MSPGRITTKFRFTGSEGRFIKPTVAAKLTADFRLAYPQSLRAHVFGGIKIRKLLSQNGCVGLRMYHGAIREKGEVLLLVGVDRNGADLTDGLILDVSVPCPSYCDTLSVLAPGNLSVSRADCSLSALRFSGDEGDYVPLSSAAKWTAHFRKTNRGSIKAHFFGGKKLGAVLSQPQCVALRIYNALDKTKARQLVTVGVTADNRDMTAGFILDASLPCPTYCDSKSPLNGAALQSLR
jgi:hypothetical protein